MSKALLVACLLPVMVACGGDDGEDAAQVDPGIATGLQVPTVDGPVLGMSNDEGVRYWKGIPFAAPPTGDKRFRAPQPVSPWTTVRDASLPGNPCAQPNVTKGGYGSGDEDCLFLNVWAPDPAPPQPLPVMVWVHGGAYITGSGSSGLYDGAALVRSQNVVIVTLNYRLGPLGFLGHSQLVAEDPASGTGNYGLLDQRAALEWVKKNIHAFGGDETKVTLFGESAGAASVATHLFSVGSAGLFQRAAIQSGPGRSAFRDFSLAEAEAQASALAQALGCTDPIVDCLRAKPFKEVIGALGNPNPPPGGLFQGSIATAVWWPVADGVFGSEAIASVVPTLLGSNAAEGALFHAGLIGDVAVTDEGTYKTVVEAMVGTDASKVLARYPGTSFASFDDALAQLETDALFKCSARRLARLVTQAGASVYRYHFDEAPDTGLLAGLGPIHAAELPFLFGNNDTLAGTAEDQPLRDAMMRYWARLARGGNPNGGSDPEWPKYDVTTDPYMNLTTPPAADAGLDAETCDFWDGIAPFAFPKTY